MGLGDLIKNIFFGKRYDLNTVEGIEAIPVKSFKYDPHDGVKYAYYDIEYVLQRKATEHKKNGRMDLAIACLRKSNQIMPLASMAYTEKDYLRLVKYLRLDKQFEEADRVEKELLGENSQITAEAVSTRANTNMIKAAQNSGSDLVSVVCNCYHCAMCSAYGNRVYSVNGKDKRFPKMPDYVKNNQNHCQMSIYPFMYGLNYIHNPYTNETIGDKDVITYSNRPFEDSRPQKWVEGYEHLQEIRQKKEIDDLNSNQARIEYEQIVVKLPNDAPKSQGGYLHMKKSNSDNFKKLKEKAVSVGIEIMDLNEQG